MMTYCGFAAAGIPAGLSSVDLIAIAPAWTGPTLAIDTDKDKLSATRQATDMNTRNFDG
jgi:hypothetical protein